MCNEFCFEAIIFPNVEAGWKAQYERTLDRCIHGNGCKLSKNCRGKFYSPPKYIGNFHVLVNLIPLTIHEM